MSWTGIHFRRHAVGTGRRRLIRMQTSAEPQLAAVPDKGRMVVYAAPAHVTCDVEQIGTKRFVCDSRIPEKPRRIGATCDSVET